MWVNNSIDDLFVFPSYSAFCKPKLRMGQKRPFVDEEPLMVSAKHPRCLERQNGLVPCLEFIPSDGALRQPFTLACSEGVDTSVPGCLFISSWTSNASGGGARPEDFIQSSYFYPENLNFNYPVKTGVHSEDLYSTLLAHSPRKSVPIGNNHQANIPSWRPQDSAPSRVNDDDKKLMGTCVVPMPDLETFEGNGWTACRCHDSGSMRCTRQHITEAREELKKTLGQKRFLELGLGDIGEEVAEKWSDDEEELFHVVVFSNPASLGKNFWDDLSAAFPSRAKEDLVSYYYNVFMLRKRAEQNRVDLMSIDSDDDEWHDQGHLQEEDDDEGEDSAIESHGFEGDHPGYGRSLNASSYGECAMDGSYCDFGSFHRDLQDDSCTSFDPEAAAAGSKTKPESREDGGHWLCDARVWGTGHISRPRIETEFLPTCSVIEAVFGDGDRGLKARDDETLRP